MPISIDLKVETTTLEPTHISSVRGSVPSPGGLSGKDGHCGVLHVHADHGGVCSFEGPIEFVIIFRNAIPFINVTFL